MVSWPVLVQLDDQDTVASLAQGTAGTLTFYTDAGTPFQAISKIALRMKAWTGFLTAP